MIALNDYQLALIMDLATPLARKQRSAFLEAEAARHQRALALHESRRARCPACAGEKEEHAALIALLGIALKPWQLGSTDLPADLVHLLDAALLQTRRRERIPDHISDSA